MERVLVEVMPTKKKDDKNIPQYYKSGSNTEMVKSVSGAVTIDKLNH